MTAAARSLSFYQIAVSCILYTQTQVGFSIQKFEVVHMAFIMNSGMFIFGSALFLSTSSW